ncbi:LysR family transcriptional regulator [Paenibacillus humicola]|uniref:LysR family transcriptional regulator n=1 Tax=Paenibacillus humicola TaxID=3110540 RepID=UPI00237A8B8F|nr:LysR family transcriptional regulator [Paenibacillus humicola]
MDNRLLEYFMAVCEEMHFTRAAEKLGISQPTLSQQIRLLERRLEAPLFHRIGKKIYLSEAGTILRKHGLKVFGELAQAQAAINELRGMKRGRLRIGCSGNHLLLPAIRSFHALYPDVELSVTQLATERTIDLLLHHKIDLGIVFLPIEDEQLESFPLYREQLQLAVSREHELAGEPSVPLRRLQHVPVTLMQRNYYVRQMFDKCCEEAGFAVTPILELSTLDTMLQAAKFGIGAAVLPKSYVETVRDDDVRIIPIVEPVPEEPIGVVYPKGLFMCTSIDTFISLLRAEFAETDLARTGA